MHQLRLDGSEIPFGESLSEAERNNAKRAQENQDIIGARFSRNYHLGYRGTDEWSMVLAQSGIRIVLRRRPKSFQVRVEDMRAFESAKPLKSFSCKDLAGALKKIDNAVMNHG